MSFTYTEAPATNQLDWSRFTVGDTREAGRIFEDAELNYLLSICTTDDVLDKALFRAKAFRHAATKLATRTANRKLGPQSEDTRDRLAYYQQQAAYEEGLQSFSGELPLPEYASDKKFAKDMMSNES